ncbi:quinon protein alcohol dehydrogenase-like superfamily [Catenaria anguillulae PL171]|uniref:Cilia- and flagella-associated protein 52 n=1 Tax=Catenaria anguillulae PL171 TaxID=765915 RepID=A0A1Y2HPR2_9FUNG|nr:quinon protein alcohol dehydrogenase-like superfamily [Catenaria anguillulae PL171]
MMSEHPHSEPERLRLKSVIGFSGNVPQGLIQHPNGTHRLFPLGSNIVIQDLSTGQQEFLQGHTNLITCLTVSKSGRYVASGQVTHMGFQAEIILWDFATRKPLHHLSLHKVKVEALAFSPNDVYLASLGGEDDNSVIVWDIAKGTAICGSPASKDSAGVTLCLTYLNNDDTTFVTGGHCTLRVWEVNVAARKVKPTDCQMGPIKRIVKCITVDAKDEYMYCGTTTGDLLQVAVGNRLFKMSGPPNEKNNFSLGIVSAVLTPTGSSIIIGAGDGTLAQLTLPSLKITNRTKIDGKVTSICPTSPTNVMASTSQSNIYSVDLDTMTAARLAAWHYSPVNDLAFPPDSSLVFATASDMDIRIWGAASAQEYLRIRLPNLESKCLVFKRDGKSLISGWTDGKIRAFGPQSGRLQWEIHDAHKKCVTALAVTDMDPADGSYRIVSGGEDGQVRIWRITRHKQTLENAMKEHKGTVTCIKIRKNNLECVSASSDGSCILWDLVRYVRNQVLFAPSFFKAVCYYPEENQLITAGTDRKVAYWEAYDGSLIREIEASMSDAINGLDMAQDGSRFVLGGSDKLVKVYRYEEGDVTHVGVGHSTDVLKLKISPDGKTIVSVSSDGSVMQWEWPKDAAIQVGGEHGGGGDQGEYNGEQ